jgi:ABC-type glycerol-3-phosphate transport system substrate-binding protein
LALMSCLVLVLGTSACTKTSFTSATTANGKQWPFCVEVDNLVGIDTLGCASTESGAEQQKADFLKLHPGVTVKVVKRVPIQDPKS